MRQNTITLFLILGLFPLITPAQSSPEMDKGDNAFDNFDFTEALYFYEVAHDASPKDPDITRRIADTYKRMGDSRKSAEWLQKTIELDGSKAEDKLHYAEALKYLGEYDQAVVYYEMYSQIRPDDVRAASHLKDKRYYVDLFADTARYSMKQMKINNEFPAIGVTLFEDEKLLVSAVNLDKGRQMEASPFLDVYMCDFNEKKEISHPVLLDKKVNSKFHDGPVFYSFSDHKLYITRNNIRNGKPVRDKNGNVNLKIYSAEYQNGEWSSAQELKFNGDNFSTGHACVSKDGQTMYIVSTREGGIGGCDIYRCFKTGNTWSAPVNLGPQVNTAGNEMFPFIGDDNILYFASDGHAGLGGLDIFSCEVNDGNWDQPLNLGSPINSSMDDFGLMYDKESDNGYFCSNRAGSGDDNIYFYEHIAITKMVLAGTIKPTKTELSLVGEKIVIKEIHSGRTQILELDEFERFEIELAAGEEVEISLMNADVASSNTPLITYEVPEKIADPFVNIGTTVANFEKTATKDAVLNIDTPKALAENQKESVDSAFENSESIEKYAEESNARESAIAAEQIELVQPVEIPVTSEYDKKIIEADHLFSLKEYEKSIASFEQAKKINSDETYPDEMIMLINQIVQDAYAEIQWNQYQQLISRADEYFHKKEFKDCIKIYNEAAQLQPTEKYPTIQINIANQQLENQLVELSDSAIHVLDTYSRREQEAMNMEVAVDLTSRELNKIQFELNQSKLSESNIKVLDEIIIILKENDHFILMLHSHTDTRGSMTYNQQLSIDRSRSVQRYMINKGIDQKRLKAECFGEKQPKNGCVDGVICDESQHSENRRVELKLITE